MTDEKIEEVLFDISGKLHSIETKLDLMQDVIMKHESRLTVLEQNFTNHISNHKDIEDDDFKTEMLRLIGKCLIISIVVIGTLTGSAGLISKIIPF